MSQVKLHDAEFMTSANIRYRVVCAECGTDLDCDPMRKPKPPHFAMELRPFPCPTCLDAAMQSARAEQTQAQPV